MTVSRRKNSLRLKGYDYSQPGGYFVSICTRGRECNLGIIAEAKMVLSCQGKDVLKAWNEIPNHFHNVRLHTFLVMPNHLHGIIEIQEPMATIRSDDESQPDGDKSFPRKMTLGNIVAYFKYEATKAINEEPTDRKAFQRSYHDHIIGDDIDWFFIRQYIQLNPIMWELDSDNPDAAEIPMDVLRERLKELKELSEISIDRVIEHELNYREWRKME